MNKQIFIVFLVLGLAALTLAGNTSDDAKQLGQDILDDAEGGLDGIGSSIKSGFQSMGDGLSEFGQDVSNLPENLENEAKELEQEIKNAPDAAADKFGGALSNLGGKIQDRK